MITVVSGSGGEVIKYKEASNSVAEKLAAIIGLLIVGRAGVGINQIREFRLFCGTVVSVADLDLRGQWFDFRQGPINSKPKIP